MIGGRVSPNIDHRHTLVSVAQQLSSSSMLQLHTPMQNALHMAARS